MLIGWSMEKLICLLTANAMSGRVNKRYCKASTIVLYSKPSFSGVPKVSDKEGTNAMGVEAGLAVNIFIFFNNSIMYYFCER